MTTCRKLADGSVIGCFAMDEGAGNPDPAAIHARVVGGRLSGTKWPVADGGIADFAVVVACDEHRQPGLFLADLKDVKRRDLKTLDPTRNQARLEFTGTPVQAVGIVRLGIGAAGAGSRGDPVRVRAGRRRRRVPGRWRAIMRWNVTPSAGRSDRSRRSSTSWRTSMSRWNWHGPTPITAPGRWARTRPDLPLAAATAARFGDRGVPSGVQGEHPDAWRHRLHLGG